MPLFSKQKSKLHIQLTNSDHASAHGGQVLVTRCAAVLIYGSVSSANLPWIRVGARAWVSLPPPTLPN